MSKANRTEGSPELVERQTELHQVRVADKELYWHEAGAGHR